MSRPAIVILFTLTSFLLSLDCAADDPPRNLLPALAGTWTFDLDYIGEYLRKGAQLQEAWCGYGWSEDEIKRREKYLRNDATRNGPPLLWEFRDVDGDVSDLTIVNNKGESESRHVSGCRIEEADIFRCKQENSDPEDEPLLLRYDDHYLYAMLKMTPDMMSCQVKNRTPAEVWIAAIRFKRVVQ